MIKILIFLSIIALCVYFFFGNKISKECPEDKVEYVKVPINDTPSNWTSDKIIPLDKYNQCDCTNDGSCIIPPDKINIFPGFNKKKQQKYKYVPVKKNNDIPIQNIINNKKKCKLCNTSLSILLALEALSIKFPCNDFVKKSLLVKITVSILTSARSNFSL